MLILSASLTLDSQIPCRQDLVNNLIKHRSTMQLKETLTQEAINSSTWELVRLLKKSPSTAKLQRLSERSPAMLQVISYMTKLRNFAQKKLHTTVEEDNSNREYFQEVKEREERAVSEKVQLEQKLKLQRVELAKQASLIQSTEDKARAELHELHAETEAHRAAINKSATTVRTEDFKTFDTELKSLVAELEARKSMLAKMREDHKAAELALRKAKKRAQQDVESVIGEYDSVLGSKEQEYQEVNSEHQAVLKKLEMLTTSSNEMYRERIEHEEREARETKERIDAGLKKARQIRAAKVIQGAWRAYKARKAAEAKKAKKAAAKKKK
jgi:hypothetical protein